MGDYHTVMRHYLYLHGFASGPMSYKAQWLAQKAKTLNQTFIIPDLNWPNFSYLTLSRQIEQVKPYITQPTILIGSSLGGLTAAWVAEDPAIQPWIERLILLAPAFNFLDQWLPRLGAATLSQWQTSGWHSVYHYTQKCFLPLHYDFIVDAEQYPDEKLQAQIPTQILHGLRDEVISIEASQQYASTRPWVTLKTLDSDHAMTDVMDDISKILV
jgi:uncharacterized protein